MEKIIKLLSEIPLFKGLTEDQFEQIRQIAKDRFYDRGKTIFLEGDQGNGFYAVLEGRVKIYKVSMDGRSKFCTSVVRETHSGRFPFFRGKTSLPTPKPF